MRFRCDPHVVDLAGRGECCTGWDWSIEAGKDKASGRSSSPRRAFRDAKRAIRRLRKLRAALAVHGRDARGDESSPSVRQASHDETGDEK